MKKVQYGCGFCAPDDWCNFDSSPTLRFERLPLIGRLHTKNDARFPANVRFGDVVRGLPVPDQSATYLYCSHVLEHLSLEDMRLALENSYRVLRSGGVFRLVMPDLKVAATRYLASDDARAAIAFHRETLLGMESRPRGVMGALKEWLGNSRHLWLWDYPACVVELEKVGFRKCRRAYFGDSEHEVFAQVEAADRWRDALGIECVR
ncbi:MAG: methyltransferase domain-containing protein [Pseudomonadota bacterium]